MEYPWEVNILFDRENQDRLLPLLDTLAERNSGALGVAGREHQSWVFASEAAALAFAYEADETCPEAVVIEPEQKG